MTDHNSLSELESLSDSDWLDISSRASDIDSVVGFDSDRELEERPSSRRSFSSTGSSHDSDVQAWEGLVYDSPDESIRLPLSLTTRSPAFSSEPEPEPLDAGAHDAEDAEEEQRVKDALDQSMMSTLSSSAGASRSNISSMHGSHSSIVHPRDLRLSFPDPLTSSHDELLNTSYEDVVAPSDAGADMDTSPCPGPGAETAPDTADPGASATPAVAEDTACEAAVRPDFYIVLYGSSSAVKWTLIDKLLEKAATGHGLRLTSKIVGLIDGYVRFMSACAAGMDRVVAVIDRTEQIAADDVSSFVPLDRPSIAVVFLPSLITALPEHTFYLPVLAQSFSVIDLPYSADQLLDAEQHWETMGVPRSKVVSLSNGSSLVVDQEEVDRAGPRQIARAFRPLFAKAETKLVQRLASRHAWTILAVLSVVLGYAIKGSLSPSGMAPMAGQQPSITPPTWGINRPHAFSVNHSAAMPVSSSISSALIPSALKDIALAVLPAPLVASTSGSRQSSVPSTSGVDHAVPTGRLMDAPSECACGCGLITWPGNVEAPTDLSLRPTPPPPAIRDSSKSALSLIPSHSHHQGKGKGKAIAHSDQSLYALNTRLAGSLSEYFDFRTVTAVVVRDLQEILDALDELVHAIGRQTTLVWEQSKGSVRGLRAQIQEKHDRARAKAMELKEMGGRLIGSVQERVRGRATVAKDNARTMRESAWAVDLWKAPRMRIEAGSDIRRRVRERARERMTRGMKRLALKH